MALSIRSSILLALLTLLLGFSALSAAPPSGPQRAVAADETGEETTTPPEEPPVIETPTEPEPTPEPETPVTTPPVTTPPVGAPTGGEGAGTPAETPKSTPSTGSEASAGGGGGGGPSSGSSGSAATGNATSAPATAPTRRTRAPRHAAAGGGSTAGGGGRGAKVGSGVGSGGSGGDARGARHHAPSSSAGGRAPQPTVSPQAIDEGASAVSNVASHVGEVFAEALPTAPLKKIGDRLAAHIAGADSAGAGKSRKQAADRIRTALGAALIGSAVAVDRQPAPSSSPIPFIGPPSGESGTIYLILIAALLLAIGALVVREVRRSLGFGTPGARVGVGGGKPRTKLGQRAGAARFEARGTVEVWSWRFRQLRASAAAGLRSLF